MKLSVRFMNATDHEASKIDETITPILLDEGANEIKVHQGTRIPIFASERFCFSHWLTA
jgi:hypothetical protein